ncbi:MAG: hypothetical protein WCC74_01250 [Minisyncoccia bacterium]
MKIIKKTGYGLIEMIVYTAIVAMVMIAIVGVTVTVIKSNKFVEAQHEIENSAILSLGRISREARSSSSVTLTSPSNANFGNSTIYLESGVIKINDGSGTSPLTSSKINVSRLFFTKITSTSSTAIRTEMTLSASSTGWSLSKVFNTTTVLRGVN